MGFTKPDFKNSVLNVTATLAEYFNAPNKNAIIPSLKEELDKNYETVVFLLFDGMGMHPLNVNAPKDGFLHRNIKAVLTSTFPSTTTNATTSVNTNLLPLEHGWFGWILHFKEIGKHVALFSHVDALTGEKVDFKYPIKPSDDYWFNYANTDYEITTVMPRYCKGGKSNSVIIHTVEECLSAVQSLCDKDGKQFVFTYCPDPDMTMHDYGVTSIETKRVIEAISDGLLELQKRTKNTLFIVVADHGQVDVKGEVDFYKDQELNDLLLCPAFLDARTPAFWVKPDKKAEFEEKFTNRYGKDFVLYKTEDLIREGYFGDRGEYGYLLGDYIAIGTDTDKLFNPIPPRKGDDGFKFKGHHTSLTREMTVPLIFFSSDDDKQ